jgi:hypothetical protein
LQAPQTGDIIAGVVCMPTGAWFDPGHLALNGDVEERTDHDLEALRRLERR